jgi:hypothetical protein
MILKKTYDILGKTYDIVGFRPFLSNRIYDITYDVVYDIVGLAYHIYTIA